MKREKSPKKTKRSVAEERNQRMFRGEIRRTLRDLEVLLTKKLGKENPLVLANALTVMIQGLAALRESIIRPQVEVAVKEFLRANDKPCGNPDCPRHGHLVKGAAKGRGSEPKASVIAPDDEVEDIEIPAGTMVVPGSDQKS